MKIAEIKSRIKKGGLTQRYIAHKMKMPLSTLSQKINGKRKFDFKQVFALSRILNLYDDEIVDIFFLD